MNNINNENKISKRKPFFTFLKSIVIGFIVVTIIQVSATFIGTFNRAWIEIDSPYNVGIEWVLDRTLTAIRLRTSLKDSNGAIANALQKIHYNIYLSAKSKISDDDPFWIEFWDPATMIPKYQYSRELKDDIAYKLHHIASTTSKVKIFNDYRKYFFAANILDRTRDVNYTDKQSEIEMYKTVLEATYPIINDFVNSTANFDNDKYTTLKTSYIPESFITRFLIIYMRIIKM